MNPKSIITVLALLAATNTEAAIKLPSVIADNMVLQQRSNVNIWGKATPGKIITVSPSWGKDKAEATVAPDSSWTVCVSTPAAGGPYIIDIAEGKNHVTLDNVLIGEVWLCSGQSNMEMPLKGFDRQPVKNGNEVIARAKRSKPIRMFLTDKRDDQWVAQWSKTPEDDMYGVWCENTPENAAQTSAVAYYFADYIQDVLDVPVGIMVSTLGGSRIEPWISRDALAHDFPGINLTFLDNSAPVGSQHNDPCVLFNGKVNPLTRYGIRGFLWYQGESNRDNAGDYARLMATMAADWRARFGGGDAMPFYFVEIAPFDYESPTGQSAALLREAQAEASGIIPNSGIVSTIDIGNHNFIHPVDKATVGQRLAWMALADTYGVRGIASHSPQYAGHEIKDGKIYINVTVTPNSLCPMWTSLEGFEIAGADGVYHPAFAEIETESCRLAVSSADVPEPKHVRYAFCNTPEFSVYSSFGLPLLPFRTDKK